MSKVKLSDYVLQAVADAGVKHVFLVPGGAAMHLNDSLVRQEGVEYVGNLHEQASAIAAEAYSRVTGGLSAVMVTAGPGGTNAITGVVGAWLDSTPCLVLSGQVKTADSKDGTDLRQLGVQEIGIVEMVQTVTKYAVTVSDPDTIRYHMEKAIYLATHGRPGPVWIDVPLDVQAVMIDPTTQWSFVPSVDFSDKTVADLTGTVKQVFEMIKAAKRPLILVGNGVRVSNAVDKFRTLVERLQIPILATWLGLDIIEDVHPLHAGRPGAIAPRSANFALRNCDLLITIGARLDMATTGYAHRRFGAVAKKVIIDIDPAEIKKLDMEIDLPVVSDAGAFIDAMLEIVLNEGIPENNDWIQQIRAWKKRYPLMPPKSSVSSDRISAYEFSRALSDAIPENTLITPGSSGFASEIFFLMLETKRGQRCFHNRGTGSMGFAIPSSIGACIASGNQHTISVDGDGGFQFNIQELATVAAYDLPIKFFVVNNSGFASNRASQDGYFQGRRIFSDERSGLKLPSVVKIAEAYGLHATRITKKDNLREKIDEVLAYPSAVVCEVEVITDEPREPRLSSYIKPDGTIESKPLEDLFPFLDREEFDSNILD